MAKEKRKSYCIICGNEKNGIEVKEDSVIRIIRFLKKNLFKSEKNNRLVVCKECYENYKKYRRKYVRRQAIYVALGVLFLIMLLIINPSALAFLIGLGMLLLLYLFSILNYVPEINLPKKQKQS